MLQIWEDRPPRPLNAVMIHPVERAGQASSEKIQAVRSELAREGAAALVVAALDEVAWLLNIRGSDVEFNPVWYVLHLGLLILRLHFPKQSVCMRSKDWSSHSGPGRPAVPVSHACGSASLFSTCCCYSSQKQGVL